MCRIFHILSSGVRVVVMVILLIWIPALFIALSCYAAILVNLYTLHLVFAAPLIIGLLRAPPLFLRIYLVVLLMFILLVLTQKILSVIGKAVIMAIHIVVPQIWVKLPMSRYLILIFKGCFMFKKLLKKLPVIAIVVIVLWFNLPLDVSSLFGGVF